MLVLLWTAACGIQDDGSSEDVATGGTASNSTSTGGGSADGLGGVSTATGGATATGGYTDDSECPPTTPESDDPCTPAAPPLTLSCGYDDGTSCTCVETLEGGGAWICVGCPSVEPQTGDSCASRRNCDYGDVTCSCQGSVGELAWECRTEADPCPTTTPTEGQTCTEVELVCSYDEGTCTCVSGGGFAGGGVQWSCDTPTSDECPAAEPADGDSCNVFNLSCNYENHECTCQPAGAGNLEWACE